MAGEEEGHGLALTSELLIYTRRKDGLGERKEEALDGQDLLFKNTQQLAVFRQTTWWI